ncbi:MAG TPA: hypothetical protein VFK86_17305 [Bauldia sp.]|nr:hypothetical protein [Bauldia sp.]
MWEPINSAPFETDLELAVIDENGEHALVFPCRRTRGGWVSASAGTWIDVRPTHWRFWDPCHQHGAPQEADVPTGG